MFVLQAQGDFECLPTSQAMAAGLPKDKVLDLWQQLDPQHKPFLSIYRGSSSDFWRVAWEAIYVLFGPDAVAAYKATVGWTLERGGRGGMWATGGLGSSRARFPKEGKGMLQLIKGRHRHAVAYCDGLIYDPCDLAPAAWAEYRKKDRGWKIEGVIPTP